MHHSGNKKQLHGVISYRPTNADIIGYVKNPKEINIHEIDRHINLTHIATISKSGYLAWPP